MSASRASSLRALRFLSAHSRQVVRSRQVRSLHMTGPATFPSPLLTAERPAFNLPKDIGGLRAECARRKLPTAGSKSELTERLSADSLQARGFSSTVETSKRPTADAPAATSTQPTRHFNTSRTLKTVKDSSTIDFAYLPASISEADALNIRPLVPLLPDVNFISPRAQTIEEVEAPQPMRPIISTVSADTTYFHAPSALADVSDNSAIDFQGLASAATSAASRSVAQTESTIKRVWNGFLEDLFAQKPANLTASR